MQRIKMLIFILGVMLAVSLPAGAAAKTYSLSFSPSPDMSDIRASVGDKITSPSVSAVNGESVWHIGSTVWSDENLYLDVNDSFAAGLSELEDIYIDVRYYDDNTAGNAFFEIKYKTPDGIEQRSEAVMCTGSGQFKTSRLTLSQAVFDNSFDGSDIVLTTRSWKYGYAQHGIKLAQISVSGSGTAAPVRGELETDSLGNIFFDTDGGCSFKISLHNYDGAARNARCVLTLKDGENTLGVSERTVSVPPCGDTAFYMEYEPKLYGAYTAELTVYSGGGEYSIERDFSYCRDAYNAKNDRMGICVHMGDTERDAQRSMLLTAKAGFGSVRNALLWADYEQKKGVYALTSVQTELLEEAKANGLRVLAMLGFSNELYTETESDIPRTYGERDAFYDYVKALVTELEEKYGDTIEAYELWNEPNNKTFNNGMKATGADYAALAQTARKALDDAGSSKKLIGLSMTGIHDPEYVKWCADAYAAGAGNYFDAMSFHPYYLTMSPERFDLGGKINELRSLALTYGGSDEVWITEHGWATVNSIPEENQAKYTVRSAALSLTDADFGNYYVYQLQDGGNLPNNREHQYGLLRKWSDTEVPYAAKKSYAALANFNYFTAGKHAVASEKVGECTRYRYESGNGEKLHIVFNAGDTAADYIPAAAPLNMELSAYDMYGNSLGISNENEGESISVSGEPVYILYRWKTEKAPLEGAQAADFGKVTVSSESAEGSAAEIIVVKDGKSFDEFLSDPSECTSYFNSVKVNDGSFSDSFYIENKSGKMRVVVFYPDTGNYECTEFELKNLLSYDISNGKITCSVDMTGEYDAFYAEYKDGVLIGVRKYTGSYTADISPEADTAALYLWKKNTMEPLAKAVVIECGGQSAAAAGVRAQMTSFLNGKRAENIIMMTWEDTAG